jgi:hypothetical protein
MKSVLGLLGLAVLSISCGGDGNALFDDVAGQSAGGNSGASNNGGNSGASNNGGSSGASNNGGSSGASNNGGSSGATGGTTPGGSGTAGTDPTGGGGGDGGDGPGPGPDVIYVATTGNDSADCGLTQQAACKSISHGVARGVEETLADVYVQAGTYAGVVVLEAGVHVLGGFDSNWQNGAHTDAEHRVIIQGALHADSQEYVAVWAHDLSTQASLENLDIAAPDAEGQQTGTLNGRSSYGVHAVSAKLALKNVDIRSGNGAKGADGQDGDSALATAVTSAMNGTAGSNGVSTTATCSVETSAGGPAGVNSCSMSPSIVDTTGGKGGSGGSRDSVCTPAQQTWLWDYTAQPGEAGANAATLSGQAGKGGTPGSGGGPVSLQNPAACGATGSGNPGVVANGVGGTKAAPGGKLVADFWYGLTGGDGGTGQNGGGGGGGGGSGGCDTNAMGTNDARGAGGGGGGAGGCAARGGGKGGGGGGGSFGIFAVNSEIEASAVTVARGAAGDGGKGGAGGQGQSGGLGQAGGALHPMTAAPGKGGNGGHGGHGGGGAGGNGGDSVGILLSGGMLSGTLTVTGGAAGDAGGGGASAPNAPLGEQDGKAGEPGNAGSLDDTVEL